MVLQTEQHPGLLKVTKFHVKYLHFMLLARSVYKQDKARIIVCLFLNVRIVDLITITI